MAYTAPSAVSVGDALTASLYNTYVKDNILDHESRIVTATAANTANRAAQVNVVSTAVTSSISTTSGAFVDITGITVNITPAAVTSKVHVFLSVTVGSNASGADIALRLVRNSTAIGVGTIGTSLNGILVFPNSMYASAGSAMSVVCFSFLDSPASTSATTYKLQGGIAAGSGTLIFNRRFDDSNYGGCSTITVSEVLV